MELSAFLREPIVDGGKIGIVLTWEEVMRLFKGHLDIVERLVSDEPAHSIVENLRTEPIRVGALEDRISL